MLTHIIRENYAEKSPKTVDIREMIGGWENNLRYATSVGDSYALHRVMEKILPHISDKTTYSELLQIMNGINEEEWKLLFLLNKELKKFEFLEKRFTDTRYLALKFLEYRNIGRHVEHFFDPLTQVNVSESDHDLHKYMLSRTISCFTQILVAMDTASRNFVTRGAVYSYNAFYAFLIQTLICARPAENFLDMTLGELRRRYIDLENRVLVNYAVFHKMILLPQVSAEEITPSIHLNAVLITEFPYDVMVSITQYKNIYAYIRLLRYVFRVHADMVNLLKGGKSCIDLHCAINKEPSRLKWLDELTPHKARIHVLLKKAIMPEFCVSLVIRRQPELNIPVLLGYDEASVPCILIPSTNKVTSIVKRLYGIAEHDRLIPLDTEKTILMNPEMKDFPELLMSWMKKMTDCLIAYCGRTDIVSYIKELPENNEDGYSQTSSKVSSDSLFHKFYIY